jgi:hypothetical protein
MLSKGNHKLGEDGLIWTFSIPAIHTCPGSTSVCQRLCYANHGHYWWPSVQDALWRNFRASKLPGFAGAMVQLIRRHRARVVRVHVAGDFYDAGYTAKWYEIMAMCPKTTFYAYTRSWRLPALRAVLEDLATLDNLQLWWSADAEAAPNQVPPRVRVAYLSAHDEPPVGHADLVFRADENGIVKRLGGALVCPVENGITETTCAQCRQCFTDPDAKLANTQRVSLPTVSALPVAC